MISGHQFRLRFRQIKGRAVGLGVRGNQIDEKCNRLPVKNIPARNETPKNSALRIDDLAQAEASRHDHDSHQRQAKRNFIADHLGAGAQSAEQRVFAIRGPSGKRHTVHAHRSDAEHNQQPDIQIGNLQVRAPGADLDPVTKRNHRDRCNSKYDRNDWRRDIEGLVHVRLRQVFFENKLDPISKRLQQPKRPDPRGSPAVLDTRRHLALQPDAVRHRRQQNKHDGNRLDQRNDDERRYAQLCPCGAGALARVLLILLLISYWIDLTTSWPLSPPQLPTRRTCFRKPSSESLNTDRACLS